VCERFNPRRLEAAGETKALLLSFGGIDVEVVEEPGLGSATTE
jgi:hypothetical protein